jgi:hypothetical protein
MLRHHPTSDDAFDERGCLKDGHVARVKMTMRDGQPVRTFAPVHDGHGLRPGHRPGFLIDANRAGRDEKAQAYADYDFQISRAYLDQPTGAGSVDPLGAQEGDICTVRNAEFPDDQGAPGHVRMLKGRLVCVPDRQRQQANGSQPDLERAQSDREAAYRAYDEQIRDAWKNP